MILYLAALFIGVNAEHYLKSKSSIIEKDFDTHNSLHKYKTSIIETPHHVLVAYGNLFCSGSLIRSRVVMTAASCFVRWKNQRVRVKVASDTVTGMGQTIESLFVKKHEYFNYSSPLSHDIALLILKEHANFDFHVSKIPLIEPLHLPAGTIVGVSGWGIEELHRYANDLLWSDMTIEDKDECQTYYPTVMTSSNFCVRFAPERRLHDNGGPVVYRQRLVGILSYGGNNSKEPFVAVITNVSYFHRWINLNSKLLMKRYCTRYVKSDEDNKDTFDNSLGYTASNEF